MNPFGSTESVLIDGMIVHFPVINGDYPPLSPKITFQKPVWLPDEEANTCLNCCVRFSPITRKHHCRNCGKIFCSKCCFEKITLPHFGGKELERVCSNCQLIVKLMIMSKSDDAKSRHEAVLGLANLLQNTAGLSKVIECGGIHIMLSIAIDCDTKIKSVVAMALHSITQNMMLNAFLIEAGCLRVLKNFLVSDHESTDLINDTLSTLNLLCMDANIRIEVLKEGMIESLLNIVASSGIAAAVATRILTLLACKFEHLEYIMQNHANIISDLFNALQNEDYQMQICVTKILMFFSAGSNSFRDMIIQEDVRRGYNLLFLLRGTCKAAHANAVCIVANISLSVHENFAHNYITGLCELLNNVEEDNEELLVHIGRGIANFAECPSNVLHILPYMSIIIARLLKSKSSTSRLHACRLLVHLLAVEMPCTINVLSQSGLEEFIEEIFDLHGITDILNNLILRKVSRLSVSK